MNATMLIVGLMVTIGVCFGTGLLRNAIEKSNDRYRESLRDDIRQLEIMTEMLECMCKPDDTEAQSIVAGTRAYIADTRKRWKL